MLHLAARRPLHDKIAGSIQVFELPTETHSVSSSLLLHLPPGRCSFGCPQAAAHARSIMQEVQPPGPDQLFCCIAAWQSLF